MGRHRSTNEAVENARRLCQVTMIRFRHMSGHPEMSQIVCTQRYSQSFTDSVLTPHFKPHNTCALVAIPPTSQSGFWLWLFSEALKDKKLQPSSTGWICRFQTALSASRCEPCHMQMVVSDASYPQMLALVGSGVHYQSGCSKKQPLAS